MRYNPQDSKNYRGKVGTGLSGMRRHLKTSTGLCRTCHSHKCIMTAYIPKYDRQWTWDEQYRQFMAGWAD